MSDSDIAIKITDIHKSFRLASGGPSSLKELFVRKNSKKQKAKKQKVLDGVDFTVNNGDFFGIVGKNGSGKSTLLKIIAGVYQPTSGTAFINGSLTPFIELGVGFNPELSGRDNVFLNGALLGFDRTAMNLIYDDIVEFAELEDAMNKKLKNYSSGMQVRLAFSIAVKAKKDILVFDEVLAVGDEAFQRKCLDVFERYKAEGQTVVLVTHDMETVKKFCNKAIILDDGKILQSGHPYKVAAAYSELNLNEIERDMQNKNHNEENHLGLKVHYEDKNSKKTANYKCGDKIKVLMTYKPRSDYQYLVLNIYKQSGEHLTGFRIPAETGNSEVEISALFSKGKYYTLFQAVNNKAAAVGDVIIGPEFMITTTHAPGIEGWSGLVPVDYKILN